MIVGSIKEDLTLEKRVSITPETAKNIIGLGLKVCVEKNYASHLGIKDNDYKDVGVDIKSSSNEVLQSSNLIVKVSLETIIVVVAFIAYIKFAVPTNSFFGIGVSNSPDVKTNAKSQSIFARQTTSPFLYVLSTIASSSFVTVFFDRSLNKRCF